MSFENLDIRSSSPRIVNTDNFIIRTNTDDNTSSRYIIFYIHFRGSQTIDYGRVQSRFC